MKEHSEGPLVAALHNLSDTIQPTAHRLESVRNMAISCEQQRQSEYIVLLASNLPTA